MVYVPAGRVLPPATNSNGTHDNFDQRLGREHLCLTQADKSEWDYKSDVFILSWWTCCDVFIRKLH
jgi:hypothetical protein